MASIFLGFYMQRKINELQESLDSALSEKRAVTQELERHKNIIAELNDQQSKSSKIQSANEARIQEVESQLQEALQRHSEKESETKELNEKLNTLEGQIKSYEEQAREAVAISETHKAALEESYLKLKHLETVVEELQNKSLYHEKETAGLNEENSKLKQEIAIYESKLGDLQSKLTAALGEKDEAVREIFTYKNAIEELATKHSSEVETLKSQISSAIDEKNLLNETNQNLKKEFQSLIFDLEEKLKEQQKNEDSLKSEVETLKAEIAEKSVLQIRLKEIEGQLIKAESRLSEEVGSVKVAASQREAELSSKLEDYAEKVNDINVLNGKVTELEKELQLSQATIANQISSAIDEKNLLNETNQNLKKELQSLIFDLEEKLKEQQKSEDSLKSEVETLKAEIAEKSVMQIRLKEIEGQLIKAESRLSEEVESVKVAASQREAELSSKLEDYAQKVNDINVLNGKVVELEKELQLSQATIANQKEAESQKLELEASLKNSLEELETKKKEISLLQKQVTDLEQKLQLGGEKFSVKGEEGVGQKDELEVKSRDIGSSISTPSKRKSKKKSDAPTAQTSSSSETHVHTGQANSPVMNFKLILGVALVSIIFGIILWKHY